MIFLVMALISVLLCKSMNVLKEKEQSCFSIPYREVWDFDPCRKGIRKLIDELQDKYMNMR